MSRYTTAILTLILCVFHISADAQYESAFTLPLPQRIKAIDTLFLHFSTTHPPAEQVVALGALKKMARSHDDLQSQIKAEALEFELTFQSDRSAIINSMERIFQLIQVCRINKFQELELWLLIKVGGWLFSVQRPGVGTHYYMQALDMYPMVDSSYWPVSYEALEGNIIGALYYSEDYIRAKEYTERSHLMTLTGYNGMRTWDLLSQIYLNLGDYTQSEYYIHKAEKIYEAADTTKWPFDGWRGIFYGYYGKIRFNQEQYQAAIPFFKDAVRICDAAHQPTNVSSFGILLAQCYIKVGKADKARELIPRIRHNLHLEPRDKIAMDYYDLALVLGEPGASPERNRMLLDSLQYWSNRYKIFKDSNQLARTELNQQVLLNKEKREQMERHIARQKNTRTLLLISLGLLSLISLAFILRKHRQLIKASREAMQAKTDLDQLKNEMLAKILHLESQQQSISQLPDDDTLDMLKSNPILTDEDWVRFRHLFEKAHRGFLDRLKRQYPDLTQGEIRFLALIRLQLTPKEMASILGVGVGAMRTMKSRLLKKLYISQIENLEAVITSL